MAANETSVHTDIDTSSGMPLGIDFGGSGIKGAAVDLERGDFAGARVKIKTPKKSTPDAVADVVVQLIDRLMEKHPDATGPVGVTVPGIVQHGIVRSAANIDKSWIDVDADEIFTKASGRDVHVMNDADAAGLAEARYGAAREQKKGLAILTTLGTGIGSAFIHDGVLVPNSELGHLEIDGHVAEKRAASSVMEDEDLSWEEWAARLTVYYTRVERLFTPDLFVVGGGVSKDAAEFLHLIDIRTPIVAAQLQNRAGIIGAALVAQGLLGR
ncbi:polyphosphate--glucose phosphotransferase [uncultured Nocardioides sp.]|uniref:polyphosphate--glucose phosphotransferase n=1 Tax=uncultured Nocardioides sp. TaxID=198441 RepID=UPI0025E9B30C|nr:ROK family protein [uncultured Nocardioides sp.]